MDYKQTALTTLLDILERRGLLTPEQTQKIRIRQGVIRALVRKEKITASQQRYDVNPVEILMGSGETFADGSAMDEERLSKSGRKNPARHI